MRLLPIALLLSAPLIAQEYNWLRAVPGSYVCMREDPDTQDTLTQGVGRWTTKQSQVEDIEKSIFIEVKDRVDGSKFMVYAEKGPPAELSTYKGKVVIVCLFATACDPSIRQLGEVAQLQPRGEAMGFVALPTHLESWVNIGGLVRNNRDHFGKTTLYKAGLGSHGLSNLGPHLSALPTTVVLDTEGRVACRLIGYVAGRLGKVVGNLLMEAKAKSAPAPAPEAKP